ncbi:MAG: hypothetical protein KJZ84_06735 [Bryobacteraceae bacterium]|nr:hypothetical protein [Bryobacteraceae bacterium]
MRRVDDEFGQQELVLLYIAKRLKEATTLEEHLTAAGIDYLVECDTYRGGFIFVSERVGAFFYVTDQDAEPARSVLARHGYRPYEAVS